MAASGMDDETVMSMPIKELYSLHNTVPSYEPIESPLYLCRGAASVNIIMIIEACFYQMLTGNPLTRQTSQSSIKADVEADVSQLASDAGSSSSKSIADAGGICNILGVVNPLIYAVEAEAPFDLLKGVHLSWDTSPPPPPLQSSTAFSYIQ